MNDYDKNDITVISDHEDFEQQSDIIMNNGLDEETNYIYNEIYKENKLFAAVIMKCYKLDKSDDMVHVIHKNLVPLYKQVDETFKKSRFFKKTLEEALNALESTPEFKFSYIKSVCDILKSNRHRKKAQIVTLQTKIKDLNTNNKRKLNTNYKANNKKQIVEVVDLDAIEMINNGPVINLDEYESDTIVLDDEPEINGNYDKENRLQDKFAEIDSYTGNHNLLVPKKVKTKSKHKTVNAAYIQNKQKIEEIEKEIAECKYKIEKLEQEEVYADTMNSPYVLSEKLKERVVQLYKKLCTITGSAVTKHHKITLKVQIGHPAGPVRKLENFLNNLKTSNGEPPFPDFMDVIKCTMEANEEDKLGWDKSQILNEATALFSQCGKALQKRRQKREWRYLMKRVKLEECERDPADDDPVLEAKLKMNLQIGNKNENAVLARYANLQRLTVSKGVSEKSSSSETAQTSVHSKDVDNDSFSSKHRVNSSYNTKDDDKEENNETTCVNHNNNNENSTDQFAIKVKKEYDADDCLLKQLDELGHSYTTNVVHIQDLTLIVEISDSEDEGDTEATPDPNSL